jgi:hypothetical protein
LGEINTPLLQQFANTGGALGGLQLEQQLEDVGLPTELVNYVSESHVFSASRHRASAMVRNLDWFNYWLLGKRDDDPAKAEQYARWDAMAATWHHKQAAIKAPDAPPTPK